MRQILIMLLISLLCFIEAGAKPALDSLRYSIPIVFEKQREVIYGDNEAEIYFSFTPKFKVDHVAVTLTSSHPDQLAIKSQGKLFSTTNQYVFTEKNLISKMRFKVVRLGSFSMASIKIKLEFKFPRQELRDWINKDSEKKYSIHEAREKLIHHIRGIPEMYEEVIGVFLYRKRFLSIE